MKTKIVKLDMQRIVGYAVEQGYVAAIDGDSVVILTRTISHEVDGVPYVSFRVDRVCTMAAMRVLLRRVGHRRLELEAA